MSVDMVSESSLSPVCPPVLGTFDISTDGDAANNSVRLKLGGDFHWVESLCALLPLEAKPDTSDFFPAAIKACHHILGLE